MFGRPDPERIIQILPAALDSRFFILFGIGIDDTFISDYHEEKPIEKVLLTQLKDLGFDQVVYFSVHRSLYYLDPISEQLGSSGSNLPRHKNLTNSIMLILSDGPLGDINLLEGNTQPEIPNHKSVMGDIFAVRTLDSIMRDTSLAKSAIIFAQTETTFRYFDEPRTFAGLLGEWGRLPASNQNICIFLFAVDSVKNLLEVANEFPIPEIRNFIYRQQSHLYHAAEIIEVPGPGPQEISNLLNLVEGKSDLKAGSPDKDKLIAWMIAENIQINRWTHRFQNISKITLKETIKQGWFSAHTQNEKSGQEQLNELIGLNNVKEKINEITAWAKVANEHTIDSPPKFHMVFSGNPGTGKTSVARLVGQIFHEIGILPRGQLVEVRAGDLVAEYVGGTAAKTAQSVLSALGGVLFIDEAYTLSESERGGFGQEAIDTLLPFLDDQKYRLIVIVAGYPNKMENFLRANLGLARRFPRDNHIDFPDYTLEELNQILSKMLSDKRLTIGPALRSPLNQILQGMLLEKEDSFGNAGEMRNFAEALARRQALRIQTSQLDSAIELSESDLPEKYRLYLPPPRENFENLFKELDQLVGLNDIKFQLKQFISLQLLEQKRSKFKNIPMKINLPHMVFTGNPGTGKTTVARLMGRFYQSMGVLRKGHCVEVSRPELVAGYVGQTALKTKERILEALDGVLFIDEAYTLASSSSDDFGREAIETLLKSMEDYQHRLLVIVAGYTNEMDDFIITNPGLSSRFKIFFKFPDLKTDDLFRLFLRYVAKENYRILKRETKEKIRDYFKVIRVVNGQNFGNARAVDKLFQEVKVVIATRLINNHMTLIKSKKTLRETWIHSDDIPIPAISVDFDFFSKKQEKSKPPNVSPK